MCGSHKPPSRYYILAALAIAVVIWLVMGAPGTGPAPWPFEIARSTAGHR
ncbi:MAG TPA: hypothetical protein VNJ49_03720 [Bradyrhizobium sp.]|nr:hypothetical protein [Bradyrhizobium sp.]